MAGKFKSPEKKQAWDSWKLPHLEMTLQKEKLEEQAHSEDREDPMWIRGMLSQVVKVFPAWSQQMMGRCTCLFFKRSALNTRAQGTKKQRTVWP